MLPVDQNQFVLRKQFLKLAGGAFRIFDTQERLLLYSEQKAFKLREDIRVFSDESKSNEVLSIKTQAILDVSPVYDVVDTTTGEKAGALRRKGLKSILMDEWEIIDPQGIVIGRIVEDSALLATLRRFLTNLIPQKYSFEIGSQKVGELAQNFNPFTYVARLDLSGDAARRLDRRLALAAGILLMAIEGKQD